MIVTHTNESHVTAEQLATALWGATPQEFHAFWLKFHDLAKGDLRGAALEGEQDPVTRLEGFARSLAGPPGQPRLGANARIVLRELATLAEFHQHMSERGINR